MSISTLANTDTFRTWLNTTNIIISTLNSNTLVAGVSANGAFAVGNTTDLSSSLSIGGAKLTANGQNLVVAVSTSLNSNVSIGASANTFTVATTGNTSLQSTVATIVSSPSLVVSANAEYSGRAAFSNTVQMTGALVTIINANVNTATVNTATLNNATISSLTVANALTYSNTFIVNGSTSIGNTFAVSGNTTFGANVSVTGTITTSNTLSAVGATTLSNTLAVIGATTLSNTLTVTGNTALQNLSFANVTSAAYFNSTLSASALTSRGALSVTGGATLSSTLSVTGAANLNSTLAVTGAANLSSTLGVTGATTIAAGLTAASLTTGGALSVSGLSTLSGGLNVTGGVITLANTSAIVLGNSANTGSSGTMRVAWSSGQTYIQSGINASTGATSNVVFGTIGATDEWMRIIASTKTLQVNGPIEYTQSQVMKYVSVYDGGVPTYNDVITTIVSPTSTTCDGFLHCLVDCRVQGLGLLNIEILGGTTGTLLLGGTGTNGGVTSVVVPIRKGDQYAVRSTYSYAPGPTQPYLLVYWVPLGTAG